MYLIGMYKLKKSSAIHFIYANIVLILIKNILKNIIV